MSRRTMSNALVRLLAGGSQPIYVLDGDRNFVYANEAFFEWLKIDEEALQGTRFDYHSCPESGQAAEIAAKLCPPPSVFQGQRAEGQVSYQDPSGEASHRHADFFPLGGGNCELAGVIAFVQSDELVERHGTADVNSVASAEQLHQQIIALREQTVPRYGFDRLVGEGPMIRRVREQVRFAHESRARTVIHGPPGSGREHIARTIHYGDNPKSAGRIVPVACSLMDAELIQATITSVLRCGDEDTDDPATLLLLDVDELPETAQYELAGFFNLPGFQIQTLSTSRHDLMTLAETDALRTDLAAALSTVVIHIPPLAERTEDIPALAQAFLEEFNAAGGHQLSGFSAAAVDLLAGYAWPNNVDELMQMVHDACARTEGVLVNTWDLPQRIRYAAEAAAYPREEEETIVLDEFLSEVEQELIRRAMQKAKGNKTKAAKLLGVTRARLHRRLEQGGSDDDGAAT